jgi:hypothetical protein
VDSLTNARNDRRKANATSAVSVVGGSGKLRAEVWCAAGKALSQGEGGAKRQVRVHQEESEDAGFLSRRATRRLVRSVRIAHLVAGSHAGMTNNTRRREWSGFLFNIKSSLVSAGVDRRIGHRPTNPFRNATDPSIIGGLKALEYDGPIRKNGRAQGD